MERGGSTTPLPADVVFTDVTRAAGIEFEHHNGRSGKKYLPETLGSGGAFLDYNGDGWPDILLINSRPWEPAPGRPVTSALYRNNQNGTFTDVTAAVGLDIEREHRQLRPPCPGTHLDVLVYDQRALSADGLALDGQCRCR